MEASDQNSTSQAQDVRFVLEGMTVKDEADAYKEPEKLIEIFSKVSNCFIKHLNNICKMRVSALFPEQHQEVMEILQGAYKNKENQSLILLSRSKQTLHSFISQIQNDIRDELNQKKTSKKNDTNELLTIRLNSILTKTEPALISKFAELLGIHNSKQELNSNSMVEIIKEYFQENPNVNVLFVLEDIDYYVENTK
jgi:hypothetical protein